MKLKFRFPNEDHDFKLQVTSSMGALDIYHLLCSKCGCDPASEEVFEPCLPIVEVIDG